MSFLQLHFGNQLMSISCPRGSKFYDRDLRGVDKIIAKCAGPKRYRWTVTTVDGKTLGTDIENDRFGCGKFYS